MKLSRTIFTIAAIIVGVWLLGLILRLGAWLISSLIYVAAAIVIIGLIRYWWESRKKPVAKQATRNGHKIIDAEVVDDNKK